MYDGAMLKEVYCELFKSTAGPRGRIQFHQGLNTVLGGEASGQLHRKINIPAYPGLLLWR